MDGSLIIDVNIDVNISDELIWRVFKRMRVVVEEFWLFRCRGGYPCVACGLCLVTLVSMA